ncbi:MAG TPA: redoxin domain-containing protein [Allosphingosinicella sp.]|jgi:cytochrome c biogenesis protein CcmG/thiol:disulfide interchange protein DsbE
MRRTILWLPLGLFLLFVIMVIAQLRHGEDNNIPSQMIGKKMPQFALRPIVPGHAGLSLADLETGRPLLVNVFASWCVPCRAEAPQLLELKRRGVPIEGIAVRDRTEDLQPFLAQSGDPFDRIGSDPQSRVQFDLGSSGVPESYIIDGKSVIRLQHIGDIRPEDVDAIFRAWEAAK